MFTTEKKKKMKVGLCLKVADMRISEGHNYLMIMEET